MDKIEVHIMNPYVIKQATDMMVCAARLTQRGHKISRMNDFIKLYARGYTSETAQSLAALPHTTLQKFAVINVAVVGASRRFLKQITRHQNEVKFMSASLQYSDYSGQASCVVPYEILGTVFEDAYIKNCTAAMEEYKQMIDHGLDNDSAGYITPQALRNILVISATPYQWKYMIGQRVCRRNTSETRYIMLKIWEQLQRYGHTLFSGCGPFCMQGGCQEGKMSCKNPLNADMSAEDILKKDFPKICG